MEILIFAALITVVALFGGLSRDAIIIHDNQKAIQREIKDYREFSTYINKGKVVDGNVVDNLITGDDVIRFVGLYRHELAIDIDTGGEIIQLEQYQEEADGSSNWDIEFVIDKLDMHRISVFKIESEIDEYSGQVMKVNFIKQ